MEDRQLSLSEVAGLMGVSDRTVRRWIKSGKLRAYKPGRDYRIPETAVREFVEESEVSPKGLAPPSLQASFNGLLAEERRARYLRSWRAFVWKLVHRWETDPPETSREIAVVLDTMQALIDEGAFEHPQEQITASDWRTASEGIELQALFMGLRRLNEIADDVEQEETAQQRRELLQALPGGSSA